MSVRTRKSTSVLLAVTLIVNPTLVPYLGTKADAAKLPGPPHQSSNGAYVGTGGNGGGDQGGSPGGSCSTGDARGAGGGPGGLPFGPSIPPFVNVVTRGALSTTMRNLPPAAPAGKTGVPVANWREGGVNSFHTSGPTVSATVNSVGGESTVFLG